MRSTARIGLLLALASAANVVTSALAHPHVYVDVDMQVEVAEDGGLTRILYQWTFDDMYSAFAIQGLTREQGRPAAAALSNLAEEMVGRLDDMNYFTSAAAPDHELQPVGAENVGAALVDGRLRLSFSLLLRSFAGAATRVRIRVFDPQYVVAMTLKDGVRINGPPHCRLALTKPGPLEAAEARQLDDSTRTSQLPGGFGEKLATTIALDCRKPD